MFLELFSTSSIHTLSPIPASTFPDLDAFMLYYPHMENDNTTPRDEVTETSSVAESLTKDLPVTRITSEFAAQISREVTAAEIILFAAAFATLPLLDFVAKAFGSLGSATQALYAIVPAAAFGLGYWFSRDKVNAIGVFLHSMAAIALLMAAIALLPMIPGMQSVLTGPGTIALGMPILTFIFLYAAARVPNTGASYLFASIAAIMIFFLSAAQLLGIPCNNALIGGSDKAALICSATPYVQNTLIPVAIFILGYFTFQTKKA